MLVYYSYFYFETFLRHLDMEIFLLCVLWPKIEFARLDMKY